MKVFISWSGETSHRVAHVLGDWLPYVIQAVKPFVSDRDIAKGERWSSVLAQELDETAFGIICVTPYNIKAPWLYFESGALSKSLDHAAVVPFLFRVDRSQLHGPLAQFQATVFDKEDIFSLLLSINGRFKLDEQLEQDHLRHTFDQWWPEMQRGLDNVPANLEGGTQTGYQWLYSPGDLASAELDAGCRSIWVVTPSPYKDLQLTCVRDVVRRNIERNVTYTFIMPSSDDNDSVRESLEQIFSAHKDQLIIQEVDAETFRSLAVTHYIVLNPEDYSPRVLLELPIVSRDFWIEVESEAAYGFVSRFRHMLPSLHNVAVEQAEAAQIAAQPLAS
jgi:hypothetical protein